MNDGISLRKLEIRGLFKEYVLSACSGSDTTGYLPRESLHKASVRIRDLANLLDMGYWGELLQDEANNAGTAPDDDGRIYPDEIALARLITEAELFRYATNRKGKREHLSCAINAAEEIMGGLILDGEVVKYLEQSHIPNMLLGEPTDVRQFFELVYPIYQRARLLFGPRISDLAQTRIETIQHFFENKGERFNYLWGEFNLCYGALKRLEKEIRNLRNLQKEMIEP